LFDTTRVNYFIDDARHFIKKQKSKKLYDLVVIDLLHGEVQPNHVFTVEGLTELRKLLKDDATIIVNYQSNYDEPNKPFLAILKTFEEAGYDTKLFDTGKDRPADHIYVASPTKLPENLFNFDNMTDGAFNNSRVRSIISSPTVFIYEL
jgi:hypothetical protein